jgi:glycosyltransferase involved in cell wall biosynthesis
VILGELRGRRAIAGAELLERRLYKSAAAIVTVTEPFREQIASHVPTKRIEVIPNGTTQMWLDAGTKPADRAAAGLPDDRFVWMYAGNLGIAQGLEHAVRAADLLGDGFRLVLLGGGPERSRLEELSRGLPEADVEFRDLVQPDVAAGLMRAADALLVPLGSAPELAKFVPSKLFDCCALRRPVIVAASGEAPRIATEAEAALVVAPGDPEALAAAVRRLRDDPGLAEELAAGGARLAGAYLRERQVTRLERLLAETASAAG